MAKKTSEMQNTVLYAEKDKYLIPEWACRPPLGTHLDVIKTKQLLQVFFMFYYYKFKFFLEVTY